MSSKNLPLTPARPALATSGPRRRSFGVVLPTFPQGHPDWSVLPAEIAAAEAAGASAFWACDHLLWHGPVLECFTALAIASTATREAVIGSAVLQLPLRSTAAVARAAASLQSLSGGRFVLGVGAGIHEGEYQAAGADFERRGHDLDRAVDRLRELWASEAPYALLPETGRIPIWVGGASDAARRRAARAGDGWIPMFLGPDRLRAAFEQLAAETAIAERPADAVSRAVLVFVSVDPDREAARSRGLGWMSTLYRLPPAKFERHLLAGEPGEVADGLAALHDAGADHLCLFVADDRPSRQIELLAPHVAGAAA